MSLYIRAFAGLVEVPDAPRYDDEGYLVEDDSLVEFIDLPGLPDRIQGVKGGVVYKYAKKIDSFRFGSGEYDDYCEELAKLAGYAADAYREGDVAYHVTPCFKGAQGAFSEQIFFSNTEGTLGTVVSAKLAKDYAAFADKAQQLAGIFDGRYLEFYQRFREAFELASNAGAVSYHG